MLCIGVLRPLITNKKEPQRTLFYCRWRDRLGRSHLTAIPCFVFCDFITSNKSTPASARSRLNLYKASPCGVLRPLITNKKEPQRTLFYCRWRDLNPQGFLHTPLKRARIPIPPHRHISIIQFSTIKVGFTWRNGFRSSNPSRKT